MKPYLTCKRCNGSGYVLTTNKNRNIGDTKKCPVCVAKRKRQKAKEKELKMTDKRKDCQELYEYIGGLACMLDDMSVQYPKLNDRLQNIQACLYHAQEDIDYLENVR